MNNESRETASAMLEITAQGCLELRRTANEFLVGELAVHAATPEDLERTTEQEIANRCMLASFRRFLPLSAETLDHGTHTFQADIVTKDPTLVRPIQASTVWLTGKLPRHGLDRLLPTVRYALPYYVFGVNNSDGSLLLFKPPTDNGKVKNITPDHTESLELHDIAHRLAGLDIVRTGPVAQTKLGQNKSLRRTVAQFDVAHKSLTPATAKGMYDRQDKLFHVGNDHDTRTLNTVDLLATDKVQYVSEEDIVAYNIVTTLNELSVRFDLTDKLKHLYRTADHIAERPTAATESGAAIVKGLLSRLFKG